MLQSSYSHQLSGEKILVTGAGGFIGSHLCKELITQGCHVHAVSRTLKTTDHDDIRWWQADLVDTKEVEHLLMTVRPEIIYHLASLVTGSRDLNLVIPSFNNNLLTTVNLLAAASNISCKRFLLIGSMEEPITANPEVVPGSPYAAAKWASSAYGRMFNALYQLPVVILRLFMVYGPGQHDLNKLIPYVILRLLRGEIPELSSGKRQIDWIYIDDVVQGLLATAQAKDIEGKTVDIGSGELISIQTVVETLVRLVGSKLKPHFGALPDRQFEHSRVADVARTTALLDWSPRISMLEGLERTLNWYRQKFNEGTS